MLGDGYTFALYLLRRCFNFFNCSDAYFSKINFCIAHVATHETTAIAKRSFQIPQKSIIFANSSITSAKKTIVINVGILFHHRTKDNCGFMVQSVEKAGCTSSCNRLLIIMVETMSASKRGWEFFHFHFASFLRFMATNLSFTQFVTWAKPLYCV